MIRLSLQVLPYGQTAFLHSMHTKSEGCFRVRRRLVISVHQVDQPSEYLFDFETTVQKTGVVYPLPLERLSCLLTYA